MTKVQKIKKKGCLPESKKNIVYMLVFMKMQVRLACMHQQMSLRVRASQQKL